MSTGLFDVLVTWAMSPRNPMSGGSGGLGAQEANSRRSAYGYAGVGRTGAAGAAAFSCASRLRAPYDGTLLGLDDTKRQNSEPRAGDDAGARTDPGTASNSPSAARAKSRRGGSCGMPERMKCLVEAYPHPPVTVGLGPAGRSIRSIPVHRPTGTEPPDVHGPGCFWDAPPPLVAPVAVGELTARRVKVNWFRLCRAAVRSLGPSFLRQVAHAGNSHVLGGCPVPEELRTPRQELDRLVGTYEDVYVRRHPRPRRKDRRR